MPLTVELIPDPDEGGFTACVPDIPAYGEGETEYEAIADLKEALRAFVETVGLDDALSRVRPRAVLRDVDLDLAEELMERLPSTVGKTRDAAKQSKRGRHVQEH